MSRSAATSLSACVLGSMELVRPLGLAGIRCAVVAPPGDIAGFSRTVETVIPWSQPDLLDHADELLNRLITFGRQQAERPVLFYEHDAQLLFVSRLRDHLAPVFRFVIADAKLVEDLVDKIRFHRLAQRLDLPVPRTWHFRPGVDAMPGPRDLRFPLIVKPPWRSRSWDALGETAKIMRVNNHKVLREVWVRWTGWGESSGQDSGFLIQELIPGPETSIESYHVYVDDTGSVVAEFTGRKIRTLPLHNGHSTALTTTDAADVAALGRSLVARLGLRGVAKFDFKRDPDGRLHLLEVNPRFNLWHHVGAVGGVNLPALVYADLTGMPRPARCSIRPDTSWCRFSEDWQAARLSGVRFRDWLSWALKCEATSLVWDDPMPFVHTFRRTLSDRFTARAKPFGRASTMVLETGAPR
ncbi:MAG: ATP-grasp domain-containing protein [Acetobacteraceae bacterium]